MLQLQVALLQHQVITKYIHLHSQVLLLFHLLGTSVDGSNTVVSYVVIAGGGGGAGFDGAGGGGAGGYREGKNLVIPIRLHH